jgi:glycine C-acetyltransferase
MRADPLSFLTAELDSLKQQGLFRHLRILEGEQKPAATIDHRHVVNLSSNNYLGLTTHPRLRDAAREALDRLGVGSGSVRTIAGTMTIHMELERRLAAFKNTEAVVVFQSGFAANAGTVAAVLSKDDVVVSDELNHASIIDGCRLSRAAIKVFPHKNVEAARRVLQELPAAQRKLLITDGVFSMDGDLGALPGLCALAEEFGCIMMVDDAHASGVFGRNGRGTIDHFDMHGRVDIPGGHAVESRRRARRLRRRQSSADRLPLPPRPPVPLLDLASAGGRRRLPGGPRRAGAGTADHRAACGRTRASSRRDCRRSGSTPGSARARSRRSSPATARWR